MPEVTFDNLLIVFVIAAAVPLLLGFGPRLRVPSVVIEIIAGVIVGPSVLGWVHIDLPLQILAVFGLAFLLFLAGLEIDLKGLRGNLLHVAVLGYLVTLVLGIAVGAGFAAMNWVTSPLLVAITLSATSLGLIVPLLKDARQADSPVGQRTIAASSIADFSAIVLLTLFFSADGGGVGEKLVLLTLFADLVGVAAILLLRGGRSMRLGTVLVRIQDTTAQIRVRFAVLLLVVRGVPALLSIRSLGTRHSVASGLLQATSLPFIVTASQIGMAAGLMTPVTGAALMCAGLLSVLIFPAIALGLLRSAAASSGDTRRVPDANRTPTGQPAVLGPETHGRRPTRSSSLDWSVEFSGRSPLFPEPKSPAAVNFSPNSCTTAMDSMTSR